MTIFRQLTLLWVLSFLVGVSACAGSSAPTPAAPTDPVVAPTSPKKVLKIGVLAPLTGPSAANGQDIRNAVTMAFETIDYTIGDYRVELISIDSQSDPEAAARAYEQAIKEEGIQVGLLNWHSSVAVAVMDMAALYKIPHFFALGATDLIVKKIESNPEKYSYWHKAWPMPSKLTEGYVIALEEAIEAGLWQPGEKRSVIYSEDTDWGHSFNRGIRPQLEGAGWTIVGEMYAALDETDFYDDLHDLEDKDIDLVVVSGANEAFQTSFVNQADEVGLEASLIADCLGCTGEWYNLTGDSSDYVLDQAPQWTTPAAKNFVAAFEARWGNIPGPQTAGLSYDYTNFFINIAQATYEEFGELNAETLYQFGQGEIKTGQITYTDGVIMREYKYTIQNGPDPLVGPDYFMDPVLQYMNGEGIIIWPAVWKEREFQPKPAMARNQGQR